MLVVFDLDFTLWDAGGTWCDSTTPPYNRINGYIEDAEGRVIYLYPDVREILTRLRDMNFSTGVASRTHSPHIARKLMDLFGIRDYFNYEEIYPGSKIQHFGMLQKNTGLSYNSMYFFDDERRNIDEVGSMGVQVQHVPAGLTWEILKEKIPVRGIS